MDEIVGELVYAAPVATIMEKISSDRYTNKQTYWKGSISFLPSTPFNVDYLLTDFMLYDFLHDEDAHFNLNSTSHSTLNWEKWEEWVKRGS